MNYFKQLQKHTAILTLTPKTPTEALSLTSAPLSVVVKEIGSVHVDIATINLLGQIFALTLSSANAEQLMAMAVQIRTNFWMLKFEEVMFALNKGINGGYGKIFGNLSYVQLAEWLNTYLDEDRLRAVTDMRIKEHSQLTSCKADVDPSIMYQFSHYVPKVNKVKEQSSESKMLGMFQAFGHTYDIDQLEGELEFATDRGWAMLVNEIKNEIEKR